MAPESFAALVVVLAAIITFAVALIRAMPIPDAWKRRKPISCNTCMVWWVGAIVGGLLIRSFGVGSLLLAFVAMLAADGIAVVFVQLCGWMPPPPTMEELRLPIGALEAYRAGQGMLADLPPSPNVDPPCSECGKPLSAPPCCIDHALAAKAQGLVKPHVPAS